MTHPSPRSTLATLVLATMLAMPLVLHLVPPHGNPLPSPLAAQAPAGTPQGRLV